MPNIPPEVREQDALWVIARAPESTIARITERVPDSEVRAARIKQMRDDYEAAHRLAALSRGAVKLEEALDDIAELADYQIPFYAYGDNEAACMMASALQEIAGLIAAAREVVGGGAITGTSTPKTATPEPTGPERVNTLGGLLLPPEPSEPTPPSPNDTSTPKTATTDNSKDGVTASPSPTLDPVSDWRKCTPEWVRDETTNSFALVLLREGDRLAAALREKEAECERLQQRVRELEEEDGQPRLTFDGFRRANVARCEKWHPQGIASWSSSDWLTAVTGELGELASLIKMRNRERDGLVGNKFSPTDKQIADELADVCTYLDLLAVVLGVDLGVAVAVKFNAISERNGFPDRLPVASLARAEEKGTDVYGRTNLGGEP